MSSNEQAKTSVAFVPPSTSKVITLSSRERTRERVRPRQNPSPQVVYTTQAAATSSLSMFSAVPTTLTFSNTALTAGVPNVIPAPVTQTPKTLLVNTKVLPVGLISTQVSTQQRNTRRVTILADPNNAGTLWISSVQNSPAGVGFPLAAGAAKDFGSPNMTDVMLNLTTMYLVGTDAGDKAEIAEEYTT